MKDGIVYLVVATLFAGGGAYGGYTYGYEKAKLEAKVELAEKLSEVQKTASAGVEAKEAKKEKAAFAPTALTAEELAVVPGLSDLHGKQQETAVYMLNNIQGSCQPCADTGRSLGKCVLDDAKLLDRTLCKNIPRLAARIVRLAKLEKSPDDIRAQVEFPAWVPFDPGAAPSKGPKSAPITIVEVSDFQCPYCKKAQVTTKAVEEKYGDKVRWAFVNLPLVMHKMAGPAARAALAADLQGKFWPFHDALFASQGLDKAKIAAIAGELGLDVAKWESDRKSVDVDKALATDTQKATKFKITSTPMFFVNGYQVKGAQPVEAFARIIDAELADL